MRTQYNAPERGDAADLRQREEYAAAVDRARRTGKPVDVCEPEQALRYRLDLWHRVHG